MNAVVTIFPDISINELGTVSRISTGFVFKQWPDGNGYPVVKVKGRIRYIHRLLAEAFIPNPQGFPWVLHANDVSDDNRLENLRWGTPQMNVQDAVRNVVQAQIKKTVCPAGHPYDQRNTRSYLRESGAQRFCRECSKIASRERRRIGIADDDPRHGLASTYSNFACRCERCRSAMSQYHREYKARRAAIRTENS